MSQQHLRFPRALAAVVVALALGGCAGGVALNRSFTDYASVYADVTNRQLLLNLARMANSHPPHVLQLGLINATFQFGSTAGGGVGETQTFGRPAPGLGLWQLLQSALTWNATVGATFGEQPTFSFTPLSGPQFARGFLAPVPAAVFFTLLEQGEPIDQLLRILVQSIEYTDPVSKKRVTVLNSALIDSPDSYIQFLRLAGIAAELQRFQLLQATTVASTASAPGGPVFEKPTLEEALKAAEKGLMLQPAPGQPGKYVLAATITATTLRMAPEAVEVWNTRLSKQPYFWVTPPDPLRAPGTRAPVAAPEPPGLEGLTLKLRSSFELMAWIATEEDAFDVLAAQPGFLDSLPPSQRRPTLRLKWGAVTQPIERPLVAVDYGGKVYAITDVVGETWNRDVFTLLSYINSQISIDPKDLPVQQLINVR